jgi:multiple sugar transport system substrate-binding protein
MMRIATANIGQIWADQREESMKTNRREFIIGASALAATSFGTPAMAQETQLRVLWWGSDLRTQLTYDAIAAFSAKHPGVRIDGESAGWGTYWERVTTQVAGGNAADIIQIADPWLTEYAERGVLLPLDDYLGNGLDIADFGEAQIDAGRVGGKLYAVSLGTNSTALIVNTTAFEEAGLASPHHRITWEEFTALLAEFKAKTPRENYYGASDMSGGIQVFEIWMRQRGSDLYNGPNLAFGAEDVKLWFDMWAEMRAAGLCAPPDLQALVASGGIDTALITQGYTAIDAGHSNQIVGYQDVNRDALALSSWPIKSGDSKPGQHIRPSMSFSISATTKSADQAVDFVNAFVKDAEMTKILGIERGVPPSEAVRANLIPTLGDVARMQVEYLNMIADVAGPLPSKYPRGAGEMDRLFTRKAEEVAFGMVSTQDGANSLIQQAEIILQS